MTVDLPPPVPDAPSARQQGTSPDTATHDQGLPKPPSVQSLPTAPAGTRAGDVTLTWRMVLLLGWLAAFFAYAAVWQASVQLGIATWWVGPRSQPTPTVIRMIPFILSIAAGLFVLYNVRWLSQLTLALAAGSLLIAIPDFTRSVGLAVVEVIISGALLVLGLGALTGRYRLGFDPSKSDQHDHS